MARHALIAPPSARIVPLWLLWACHPLRARAVEAEALSLLQVSIQDTDATETSEQVFSRFDADASGTLGHDEVAAYLGTRLSLVTPAVVNKLLRKSDKNADWALNFQEFAACILEPACSGVPPPGVQVQPPDEATPPDPAGSEQEPSRPAFAESVPTPPPLEECTAADREILRPLGVNVDGKDQSLTPPKPDPVHQQLLQVRGVWTHAIVMPQTCKVRVAQNGLLDADRHGECLQEILNISAPCARCNAGYLEHVAVKCPTQCSASLNSPACIECTQPVRLLECLAGTHLFRKRGLASARITSRWGSRDGRAQSAAAKEVDAKDPSVIDAFSITDSPVIAPESLEESLEMFLED